jgi:aminomethyltransferase
MVPFAGYEMPVQYRGGIIAEHLHSRGQASLFDVSHMGQLVLEGGGAAATLEALVPADVEGLATQRQCYTLLMNDAGGVRDDLIITRWGADRFLLVVNAACKAEDRQYIASRLSPGQTLRELDDQGLLALQGPQAREVLRTLMPEVADLTFLDGAHLRFEGTDVFVSCSGYTGEDGFELSVPGESAEALARRLLAHPAVAPAGLGARDSLRLEAGLCLYGHELSAEISPVEAGLTWSIGRARRPDGARAGGYPGAGRIAEEMVQGAARRRVGLAVTGRRPVREGQVVLDKSGAAVGVVTSGGFGASVEAPIAMAYVTPDAAAPGTALAVDARGKQVGVTVAKLPFVAPRYYRG